VKKSFLFIIFLLSTVYIYTEQVDSTNYGIANASPGDYIIRQNGEKIVLNQGDIDYAKKQLGFSNNHTQTHDSSSGIISSFFSIVFIFIIIIVIFFVFRINKPRIKGFIGELKVAWQLDRLNAEEYKVFNNVLIVTGNESSQIDHVVISKYGIFVIETKNYKGWIFGNENDKYWTQVIFRYKTKIINPIKQNWNHVHALKNIFPNLKNVIYYPIIVFAGNANLKKITSTIPVIYNKNLFETIMSKREIINLSNEEMTFIENKLLEINTTDRETRNEHINRIKRRRKEWKTW
jgi:cbb3-type cytochrome oxidase subunit 3